MYCLHFPENRELLIAVPLSCRGEVIYRDNFLQHTQFIAAGLDVSWYENLFAGKKRPLLGTGSVLQLWLSSGDLGDRRRENHGRLLLQLFSPQRRAHLAGEA